MATSPQPRWNVIYLWRNERHVDATQHLTREAAVERATELSRDGWHAWVEPAIP